MTDFYNRRGGKLVSVRDDLSLKKLTQLSGSQVVRESQHEWVQKERYEIGVSLCLLVPRHHLPSPDC